MKKVTFALCILSSMFFSCSKSSSTDASENEEKINAVTFSSSDANKLVGDLYIGMPIDSVKATGCLGMEMLDWMYELNDRMFCGVMFEGSSAMFFNDSLYCVSYGKSTDEIESEMNSVKKIIESKYGSPSIAITDYEIIDTPFVVYSWSILNKKIDLLVSSSYDKEAFFSVMLYDAETAEKRETERIKKLSSNI